MRPAIIVAAVTLLFGLAVGFLATYPQAMRRNAEYAALAVGLNPDSLRRGPREACPGDLWSYQAREFGTSQWVTICVSGPIGERP